jgi:hypothetical protein
VNNYQATVLNATGWVLVLLDGWEMHTHWIALVGFIFLIYSTWRMVVVTPEDEEFERIEREQAFGWRKRHVLVARNSIELFEDWEHSHRPEQYWVERRAYLAGFEEGRRYARIVEKND